MKCQCYWQVVVAAFLRQIGGREIDDDALLRERQPGSMERAAHPFAALGDRFVREPDDYEFRQPRRDLHLHVNGNTFDPLKRNCRDVRNHGRPGPGLDSNV
jgi:hypothetical protein